MSDPGDNVEERKRQLIARSTLYRLTLQREIEVLRHSLHSPRALLSFAALPAVRSLLFGSLLLFAGRGGVARLLRGAMTVLALVKAGRAAAEWMKAGRGAAAPTGPGSSPAGR